MVSSQSIQWALAVSSIALVNSLDTHLFFNSGVSNNVLEFVRFIAEAVLYLFELCELFSPPLFGEGARFLHQCEVMDCLLND